MRPFDANKICRLLESNEWRTIGIWESQSGLSIREAVLLTVRGWFFHVLHDTIIVSVVFSQRLFLE